MVFTKMYFHLVLLLSSNVFAFNEDLTIFHGDDCGEKCGNGLPKLIDIYTNHENVREVLRNYRNIGRRRINKYFQRVPTLERQGDSSNVYSEKVPQSELENTHLDRIDFHYPNIEEENDGVGVESDFGTIVDQNSQNDKRYVFVQSQKVLHDLGNNNNINRRPKFKTQKYSNPYSFVQKIPKPSPDSTDGNKIKYQETVVSSTSSTTKNRINTLLKNYLAKLYSQKYTKKDQSDNPKTKYLDSSTLWNLKNKTVDKINKIFSLFTVVQFNNTQCNTTNSAGTYQGICYTSSECTTMGGTALGDCASGYGVCCVSIGTCGGSASGNCSYFQNPNYPDYYPSDGATVVPTTEAPTSSTEDPDATPDPRLTFQFYRGEWERQGDDALYCVFDVYKLNGNVSKMRIDFLDLELTGPVNGTCIDERLVISGQNANNNVPVICGYNTGQHVYVDVSSLSGPLQISVLAAMSSRKRFRIRICQFEDSCLEPSSNCLQYYTGVTGVISSFNYDQASMFSRSVPGYFNNLNYAICIRREEGYCAITYRNVMNDVEYPFQLTNVDESGDPIVPEGQAGADIFNCPDDYIVIGNTRLCGDKFNDGSVVEDFTQNADVTDTGAGPIVIPVRTDAMVTGLGFKLFYTQIPCMTMY